MPLKDAEAQLISSTEQLLRVAERSVDCELELGLKPPIVLQVPHTTIWQGYSPVSGGYTPDQVITTIHQSVRLKQSPEAMISRYGPVIAQVLSNPDAASLCYPQASHYFFSADYLIELFEVAKISTIAHPLRETFANWFKWWFLASLSWPVRADIPSDWQPFGGDPPQNRWTVEVLRTMCGVGISPELALSSWRNASTLNSLRQLVSFVLYHEDSLSSGRSLQDWPESANADKNKIIDFLGDVHLRNQVNALSELIKSPSVRFHVHRALQIMDGLT